MSAAAELLENGPQPYGIRVAAPMQPHEVLPFFGDQGDGGETSPSREGICEVVELVKDQLETTATFDYTHATLGGGDD